MIKTIDIKGGYHFTVVFPFSDMRAKSAAWAAEWLASHATAAWCIAPDHHGNLEICTAREGDLTRFQSALIAAIA